MNQLAARELILFSLGAVAVVLVLCPLAQAAAQEKSIIAVATVDGMPAVLDPSNVYSEAGAGHLSPAVSSAFSLVRLGPVQLMVAMLGGLLFSRLNSALGHLVKMTADLFFGAA
jgi:hypothetical protein